MIQDPSKFVKEYSYLNINCGVRKFLIKILLLSKMRVLVSSLKHNLVYRSTGVTLNRSAFLLVFLYPYVKSLHGDRPSLLAHRLVVLLDVEPHELRDVEDQSLK